MFGSLKKKLQEAVKKVTGRIEEKQIDAQSASVPQLEQQELPKEEQKIEQPIKKIEEIKKETPISPKEDIRPAKVHEPEAVKKIESELEKFEKEEKQEQTSLLPLEEKVKEIIKEEEKIYDREQEIEKKIDILKEREIEEEFVRDQDAQKLNDVQEPKADKKRFSLLKKITEKKLTEDDVSSILKELEMAMMENDVAVEVVEKISAELKKQLVSSSVKRGEAEKTITEALRRAMMSVLHQEPVDLENIMKNKKDTLLVVLLGFNGVGKTTTLAKLAHKFKIHNPVLAAGDTFRAASIEQLEEHAKRLNVRLIKSKYGADSAAVIFDAKKHASASGSRLVLADTAGRSHTNVNLMDELKKVCRVNKPDLKILVLDALAGNDIYEQARLFDEAVGVDAIILTKSDVYDRGGAALSAAYALKKPILFLGTGQEYDDLVEFSPEIIVKNLLE